MFASIHINKAIYIICRNSWIALLFVIFPKELKKVFDMVHWGTGGKCVLNFNFLSLFVWWKSRAPIYNTKTDIQLNLRKHLVTISGHIDLKIAIFKGQRKLWTTVFLLWLWGGGWMRVEKWLTRQSQSYAIPVTRQFLC